MPPLSEALIDGMPVWFFKGVALMIGACFGSFANVVIYRVPLKKSIVRPGSSCPACGHEIRWYENIPILSWVFLRAKCSRCSSPISIRYPLVELVVAVLSLACLMIALARVSGINVTAGQLAALWFFPFSLCFLLVCVIFIDLEHWIIPHPLTIIGMVLGLAHSILISGPLAGVGWRESLIGIAAGALPIVLLIEVYYRLTGREGMGYGDVMLMGMAGAWFGYLALPFILLASSVQGLVATVPMILMKKRSTPPWETQPAAVTPLQTEDQGDTEERTDEDSATPADPENDSPSRHMAIPFGPFIGLAMIEWLFFGDFVREYFFGF